MDLSIVAIIISAITMVFMIINFALTRKDKAVKDTKEDNYVLLNYKIDELKKDFAEFSSKFDRFENEIDNRIDKAFDTHIKMYHSKG